MKIKENRKLTNEGFTLIEMLIVIALIGMIAAFVGSKVIDKFNQAKVDATKIQIKQLGSVLDQFKMDCGFYPLTDQGLDALLQKPGGRACTNYDPNGYLKGSKIPKDGFSNDFIYESIDGKAYVLKSLGNDKVEGGDGVDADISSDAL